jgi:hypothetical protein
MHKVTFINRVGRAITWSNPLLYRSFGLLRGKGDCFDEAFDLWIDGFPRSANTFALHAFKLANPGARVISHRHVPPFVIRWLHVGKPGIFLLRKPEDAAVSWAIYWSGYLEKCLDYYIDYHRALRPYARHLFIAPFETTTSQFGRVIEQFNRKFGTHYATFNHEPEAVAQCFSRIEDLERHGENGAVHELRVCRPSAQRAGLKPAFLKQLRTSRSLARKLQEANELYAAFHPAPALRTSKLKNPVRTQQLPMLS